jgi:hypothetical protein
LSGNDADMAKMSAQQKKDCDNNDDMFACGVFAMFMEGKDNKEAAKYYKNLRTRQKEVRSRISKQHYI